MKYLLLVIGFSIINIAYAQSHTNSSEQGKKATITLRNNASEIIVVIDEYESVREIGEIIIDTTAVESLDNNTWTHKLDFSASKLRGRWLYNAQSGYLSKLNKKRKPSYKLTKFKRFNELLGL